MLDTISRGWDIGNLESSATPDLAPSADTCDHKMAEKGSHSADPGTCKGSFWPFKVFPSATEVLINLYTCANTPPRGMTELVQFCTSGSGSLWFLLCWIFSSLFGKTFVSAERKLF